MWVVELEALSGKTEGVRSEAGWVGHCASAATSWTAEWR